MAENNAKALDRFYTKAESAQTCFALLQKTRPALCAADSPPPFFVEPAAGAGAFYNLLPPERRVGIDVQPAHAKVLPRDFLHWNYRPPAPRAAVCVIGNPPFGRRGFMAVQFIRRAAQMADTVAFILPALFGNYSAQKQLPEDLRLIVHAPLPRDSFALPNGRPYSVNAVFQIWTRLQSTHKNLRALHKPRTVHPDFALHQYNNTRAALPVFMRPFDFAVPCQGWQDYTRRETEAAACEKTKQWMLIKCASKTAHELLYYGIDYQGLALSSATAVPGFRKHDVVRAYENAGAKA